MLIKVREKIEMDVIVGGKDGREKGNEGRGGANGSDTVDF